MSRFPSGDPAVQFQLDPDVVFLNHGSYGACPEPVFAAYQDWQRLLERQPVAFLDPKRELTRRMRHVREVLGTEIGVDPDDLVPVVNATAGLNIAINALDLKAGDEVVTTDHEYAALEKAWAAKRQDTGAKIIFAEVPLPLTSKADFEGAILERFSDRTRVLFVSHITSPTALRFPVERLVSEARSRGITTIIDGAHAPGQIELDLEALGADFYSGNCHKWMMTPKGSAFLHVRREWQERVRPLYVSHGWTEETYQPGAKGSFGNSAFIDRLEFQATRDPSAWFTVPAGIAYRHQHDWWKIVDACSALVTETSQRITELTSLPPLSSPEFRAPQMASIPVPDCDPDWLKGVLLDKYRIEMPTPRWRDRSLIRLSVQAYNTQAQMDLLVEAIRELFDL